MNEGNSELENDIDKFMNDSNTEFVLEESLENKLDPDNGPLNLPVLEANYHLVENPTIKKKLWMKAVAKLRRK